MIDADFERGCISLITNDTHDQESVSFHKNSVSIEQTQTTKNDLVAGSVPDSMTRATTLRVAGVGLVVVNRPISVSPIVVGSMWGIAGETKESIVSALINNGVTEHEAPYYAEGIRRGGALISLQTSRSLIVEDIIQLYGSIDMHHRTNLWWKTGWQGFDADDDMFEDKGQATSDLDKLLVTSIGLTAIRITRFNQHPRSSQD